MQFTRNDRDAGRVNGATAAVVGIDAEKRLLTAIDARGREHTLALDRTGDRHGWVGTVHGSLGATADRSLTHLESFRANTVDAKTAYVAISRARSHAAIYTNSKEGLANAIETRTGERATALAAERATPTMERQAGKTRSVKPERGISMV